MRSIGYLIGLGLMEKVTTADGFDWLHITAQGRTALAASTMQ